MRMMRKMWCDVMRSKDRWDWWMWWDRWDLWVWPWVFVQGRPVVQQPGCGCMTLHPCSKPSSSRWPCGMSEEPLFAWWWWCLEFWNLMIWIWLSDIEKHYALFCAADKALSCTPQTNRVFICWECAALYTRCRVVPSPLTPLLSSAAPRPLRRCAVQPYVRTSAYNRLCFADCKHCRSTK